MSSVSITSFIGLTHWLLPQLQALVILQADSWGPLSPHNPESQGATLVLLRMERFLAGYQHIGYQQAPEGRQHCQELRTINFQFFL